VVEQIHRYQQKLLPKLSTRFVFAADEFYLSAALPFPALSDYEDLQLLENGVGLIPLFRHETQQMLLDTGCYSGVTATLVTGVSAQRELEEFARLFNEKTKADLRIKVVHNDFFGSSVTVTGLVVGTDIINQLIDDDLGQFLIIPDVMCREGEEIFLDDVNLEQLAEQLQVEVVKVPASPWGIMEFIDFVATQLDNN
jgi:NifB/MoaA-like Fe-S oxidoreductase